MPSTLTMLRNATPALSALVLLLVTACGAPNASFYNRGPESLLDVSSEVVNLSVRDQSDLAALTAWIEKDHPTRADLQCDGNLKQCQSAVKILEDKEVNVSLNPSPNNTVTLYYERIVARDCNQRYIDNGFTLSNAQQPSFGCAISANMVQQVSDKQEFINPAISDNPSAITAVSGVRRAYNPPKQIVAPYNVTTSATSSSGGGGGGGQ